MKYSVVLLFALAVAVAVPSSTATGETSCMDTCADNVLLGDLFKNYIKQCVTNAVNFLIDVVLQLIDGTQTVPVLKLLPLLEALKNPTLGDAIDALNSVVDVAIGAFIDSLPCSILRTSIVLDDLLQALAPALQAEGDPKLQDVLKLSAGYVSGVIAAKLSELLNALPTLS